MSSITPRWSRRGVLGAGALALGATALPAFAKGKDAPQGDWRIGFRTAPAQGLGPTRLELVSGRAPKGFAGTMYRNGPGQLTYGDKPISHWFDGDGLIHRIRFDGNDATHVGRFAATPKRAAEQAAGKPLAPGFGTRPDPSFGVGSPDDANAANTSVIVINGELLALWEAGSPWRLDAATLESGGPRTWREDLAGMPFLAHPKRDPDGRIWNLARGGSQVGVYRISATGELESFDLVDIGVPAYIHDWTLTEKRLILLVQPWVPKDVGDPLIDDYEWRPQDGLKVLILDKADLSKRRWAQAPARAFYHTGGAWEDAEGTITLDAVFYKEPVLGAKGAVDLIRGETSGPGFPDGVLTQMVIPPSGDARLQETSVIGEFPLVDPRRHGLQRKLTVLGAGGTTAHPGMTGVALHDWSNFRTQRFDYGADHIAEEHLYVPKPGKTGERDAWLVGTSVNLAKQAMEVAVFDAKDVSDGPLAVWRAPYAWPLGFHGTWAA
jgi:carotenoid cleavage dioxygenase-like enzyme